MSEWSYSRGEYIWHIGSTNVIVLRWDAESALVIDLDEDEQPLEGSSAYHVAIGHLVLGRAPLREEVSA